MFDMWAVENYTIILKHFFKLGWGELSWAEPRDSCEQKPHTRDVQPVAEVVAMMIAVVEKTPRLDRDLRASEQWANAKARLRELAMKEEENEKEKEKILM